MLVDCDHKWGFLKLDHLIVKAGFLKVEEISYNWDFLDREVRDGNSIIKNNSFRKGFPDHAMFIAKILFV